MELNTYITFGGQCEAAFRFYERILGGKITMMLTHAETPPVQHVPKDWQGKIMHARLQFGDRSLMACDAPPGHYEQAKGFHVQVGVSDATEADRIYHALAANGTETMPIQETFWAARFGMLVDQFGIPWMINCEKAA
jgi:PhnB protein